MILNIKGLTNTRHQSTRTFLTPRTCARMPTLIAMMIMESAYNEAHLALHLASKIFIEDFTLYAAKTSDPDGTGSLCWCS